MHGFLAAWIPLLVAVDPIGALPVFVTAGMELDSRAKARLYYRSIAASAVIALLFIFAGRAIFSILGIEPAAFKIAGGTLLFIISLYEMVWASPQLDPNTEPAFVPLSMPITMGPAAITTTVVLVDRHGLTITLAAMFATLGCLLGVLLLSRYILKLVSINTIRAIGKLIYLLLAAIGVQFIHSGIIEMLAQPIS